MTDPISVRKAVKTPPPGPDVCAACLPAEMLPEAVRRLGWAGLLYAGAFFVAFFGGLALHLGAGRPLYPYFWLAFFVTLASIALGFGVFALTRYSSIRLDKLLDLGLVFEVVGALGISMTTFWAIWPQWSESILDNYIGVPWECVWIVMFPWLSPNTPGKTLLASLAAASTAPVVFLLSKAYGATSPDAPVPLVLGYFLLTTYLCAGMAFVISLSMEKLGKQLRKARDIGSYQVIKRLGQGGMGEVWVARHRMLARPAAVKLIRPEVLGADAHSRDTALRRFEREAQATAALRSYHTIDVYDFGVTEEGAFYYVMELLEGLSADVLVKRYGPLPAGRAVYLLRQVCHSLSEAHGRGMIHRDIKPANIFVCRSGPSFDFDFVKVLDFGLVKSQDGRQAGSADLTGESVTTGTPAFMAPEMIVGKGDIDGRVDIYALGCVGYWLLTGEHVFECDTPMAAVVAHVQQTPMPPSRSTELEIPTALDRVILACLEKDPADRPQTAADLDAMLSASVADEAWSTEAAREWWELHRPAAEQWEDSEAIAELSPEGIAKVG